MPGKVPGIDEKPVPLKKIGILGAGLMGLTSQLSHRMEGSEWKGALKCLH